MAEANISVPENHFQCPICLELLKDPVTIPCGHSYCTDCIKKCWDQDEDKENGVYSCPQCGQTFNPRPVLGRNPILADMVAKLKAQGLQSTHSDDGFAGPDDVECTICVGRKRKADKSCLECLDSYCPIHLCRHEELHAGKKHKVVDAAVQLQKKMCSEHGKPLEAFCETDSKCVCVECIIDEHKGHDVVSLASAKENNQRTLQKSLQKEISERESELNRLRENVESLQSSAKASVEVSESNFTELLAFFERMRSEVPEMIRAQEKAELSREEQRQEEVNVLKTRAAEMEQLASKEDEVQFLQNLSLFSPEDLPRVTFNAKYAFRPTTVEFYLKRMMKEMEKTYSENVGLIWSHVKFGFLRCHHKQMKRYSVHPKFDSATAFRHHLISEDNTKVEWSHKVVSRGRRWDRFTDCRQVFCSDALPEHAYWEVEWSSVPDREVAIAVAYSDIEREGVDNDCRFGRNDESWCLELSGSCLSFFHNNVETEIPGPVPSRVGVYLNRQAEILSFYRITDRDCGHVNDVEIIFSVKARFNQKTLYPGFYVDSSCCVEVF